MSQRTNTATDHLTPGYRVLGWKNSIRNRFKLYKKKEIFLWQWIILCVIPLFIINYLQATYIEIPTDKMSIIDKMLNSLITGIVNGWITAEIIGIFVIPTRERTAEESAIRAAKKAVKLHKKEFRKYLKSRIHEK